jgi:hypothetical protein
VCIVADASVVGQKIVNAGRESPGPEGAGALQRPSAGRGRTVVTVRDEPTHLRVSCSGCEQTWYGIHRCHCPSCHVTLPDEEYFSRHRVGDDCVNPVKLGLYKHERSGCWEPRAQVVPPRRQAS